MFEWREDLTEDLFIIPPDFREDPNRFPDLWLYLEANIVHILTSVRELSPYLLHDTPQNCCMDSDSTEGEGEGEELYVGIDMPMTNLGNCSDEVTLLIWLY